MTEFKANFSLISKDFKTIEYKPLIVKASFNHGELYSEGNIEYSIKIPDYIFNELADTEDKFKTTYDINNKNLIGCFSEKTLTYKFKKTQTSKLLSNLKDLISLLSNHILEKYSLVSISKKKKIFIKFSHNKSHLTNNWCGSYKGEQISQSFNYFIGYEIYKTPTEKKYITHIEYHSPISITAKRDTNFQEDTNRILPLNGHNQSTLDFEKHYIIIDWTLEREEFCEKIKQTFLDVNKNLSEFLTTLDNQKIDSLISNNNFKLLFK